MTSCYTIGNAASILGKRPALSRFAKKISDNHLRYFGGHENLRVEDTRTAYTPRIGHGISEKEAEETWDKFDEQYRSCDRISKFWVTEFQNAVIFPPHGIIAVGDTLLQDTIRSADQLTAVFSDVSADELKAVNNLKDVEIKGTLKPHARSVSGLSFLLGFGLYENYFNWTLRYTSRIGLYQAQREAKQLIVPPLTKGYIADTLEHFGITQDECCILDGPLLCERLQFISPVALGRYELSPLITVTLRNHPRVSSLWRTDKKPLYIPRRNVKMRLVTNEEEVENTLIRKGFNVFDNADYSIKQQIKAFRNASAIIAPHGAGLSNIVYSDPGTPVVEIVPEGYDQGVTSYRSLSDLFELSYTQLLAREASLDRKGNRCNSDIEVDIGKLINIVKDFETKS